MAAEIRSSRSKIGFHPALKRVKGSIPNQGEVEPPQ
jgi:hypothetical protein